MDLRDYVSGTQRMYSAYRLAELQKWVSVTGHRMNMYKALRMVRARRRAEADRVRDVIISLTNDSLTQNSQASGLAGLKREETDNKNNDIIRCLMV